ncbi:hypothetical protein MMC25_001077 [Agyrium rufum]|nr:hypothetical protein [Agyrium rufum]
MRSSSLLSVLGALNAVRAQTTSSPSATTDASACATVSALSASYLASNPEATAAFVSADIAYECLKSVPIKQDDATSLLDGMIPYVQFQSTLAYLKDPPSGYLLPPADIVGGLQAIRKNVTNGVYDGEFDFQTDVQNLITTAHDGHFYWFGDALHSALQFAAPFYLVSISTDGTSAPEIYVLSDVTKVVEEQASFTASSVATINGQDAVPFLKQVSLNSNFQDPDALYNNVFYEAASLAAGNSPSSYYQVISYPGPSTNLTFTNGSSTEYRNRARVIGDFTGVVDGETFYDQFCNATKAFNSPSSGSGKSQPDVAGDTGDSFGSGSSDPATSIPGYPTPEVISADAIVAGYFLDNDGYEDVAVLAVASFEPTSPSNAQDFQGTVQAFLAEAVAEGKKRLVIDLSSNGGGDILLGYDLFLQLFPDIYPFGGTNMRAHYGLDYIGQFVTSQVQGAENSTGDTVSEAANALQELGGTTIIDALIDFNRSDVLYNSWDELYGPVEIAGDNFTNILRFDLSLEDQIDPSLVITTTGGQTNLTQPFAAQDIIMVTDGYCGSTCTIFAQFMKSQAGVKSYVFGGRPDNTGPMQAIGGVKGAQVIQFQLVAQEIAEIGNLSTIDEFNDFSTQTFAGTDLENINLLPILRASPGASPSFNIKNNINMNDTSFTPLQFVYEAADCRLWYTANMIVDVRAIWETAYSAAYTNSSLCTPGSTNDPSSLSGKIYSNTTAYGDVSGNAPTTTTSAAAAASGTATGASTASGGSSSSTAKASGAGGVKQLPWATAALAAVSLFMLGL